MGSYNSNIMPANTGLALGNSNQQWIAYLSNAFAGTVQSTTFAPALSGFIRLASADFIAWRNNANTGDIVLSKTSGSLGNVPADTLILAGGGGIQGPFISNTANPAASGQVRLAASDAVSFRNNANSGDVVGLSLNSNDTATVGNGTITQTSLISAGANPASTGVIRLANADQINWRNAGNSADEGISNAPAGGLQLNGANPNIRLGGATASFPMIKRNGVSVEFRLADDSALTSIATNNITSLVGSYNSYALAGNGLASNIKAIDLTGQTAAVGLTALITASGAFPAAGQYRVSWNAKITTVAGSSSTLGPLTVTYIDPDSTSQAITCAAQTAAGAIATTSAGNLTTTVLLGVPFIMNLLGGMSVNYSFGYASNAANVMTYNLHIVVERL